MKVALVQAPVWWTLDPPLGLAQIAGCAELGGHETHVFDLNILLWKNRPPKYENMWLWEQFHFWNNPDVVRQFFADNSALIEGELMKILRSDAKVIGFSVYLGAQWASLELARMIKKEDPSRLIVWGGQFFFKGDTAAQWMGHPEIDGIVRGHGDFVFPQLLKKVAQTGRLEPLPGVLCRVDGKVVDGGAPPPVKDLDDVPFAEIKGFPLELYTDRIRIPFAASRGCVWKCHFCSSTQFWSGYTYMSGERIFAEVRYHKNLFPWKSHLEFYDITANGNVKSLVRFSELVSESERRYNCMQYGWKINAIIRPEMTPEVLGAMRKARCQDIIYGIESGSRRVLTLMNKPFEPQVADRVLRDTHEAGIRVTANIMFGFPGETEEDFGMTLDFLKRNSSWLDRAYGSATFTSLEEHSYLTANQDATGIKEVPAERFHNLYWESKDGTNNYEVRLNRYKRFRELAIALGVDAYKGVNGNLEQDHLANLAQYKQYKCDHLAAIEDYLEYLEGDLYNGPMRAQLAAYQASLRALARAQRAVEKANRWLETESALAQDFIPWAAPHLNNGGLPPVEPERPEGWRSVAAALSRARRFLMMMPPDQRAAIHPHEGRFRLIWIEKDAPPHASLKALEERVSMVLGLAQAEIARGEDKKEPPRCQR